MDGVDWSLFRVVTMNVYGPSNPDWPRRSTLIADTIRQLQPDVLALQEAPLDDRLAELLDVDQSASPIRHARPSLGARRL
ncbi:hypothetical protein GIS00_26635 [Nakamurella sp. YIM 132087]|uniref:Endonuclease/exonuclease/phosphatase domain-containing protein n=1 Tax=Nakamurella alba TaxID=2665158 RepID=A0A7K1FTV1_9ACTN|nr:endonuclease/exonuclease/phosphatase family protein [Nakamurella alba]MTD17510.1 hypothetical protein [Nakamurella alba]